MDTCGGDGDSLYFQNASTGGAAPTTKLIIKPSGNIGIGTSVPGAKLTVKGSGTGTVYIGEWGGGNTYAGVSMNGSLATGNYNILSGPADTNLYINRPTGKNISIRENNGTNQVTILSGGNVGIGTTNPTYKLDVNGGINMTGRLSVPSSFSWSYGNEFTNLNNYAYVDKTDDLRWRTPYLIEYYNGSSWVTYTGAPNFGYIADGRANTEASIPNTVTQFRLYYQANGCISEYALIQQAYIPVTYNFTAERSVDGTSWTNMSTASGLSGYQQVVNLGPDSCQSYRRFTFNVTNYNGGTSFRLLNMMLYTTRAGDQGGGMEKILPLSWDYLKNVTMLNNTYFPGSGIWAASGNVGIVAT